MFLWSVIGMKVYAIKEITLSGAGAGPQATHKRSGGQTQPHSGEMQRAAPKHSLNPVFTGEQMRAEIKTLGASCPSPGPRKIAADTDRPAGARRFQRSPNGRHLHNLPPPGASRAPPTLCPSPQLTLRVHCAFEVAASNRHGEATCQLLTSKVHDPRSRLLALEPEAVRTTPPAHVGKAQERGWPCRPSPCMRMRARCTCSAHPGHQGPPHW